MIMGEKGKRGEKNIRHDYMLSIFPYFKRWRTVYCMQAFFFLFLNFSSFYCFHSILSWCGESHASLVFLFFLCAVLAIASHDGQGNVS